MEIPRYIIDYTPTVSAEAFESCLKQEFPNGFPSQKNMYLITFTKSPTLSLDKWLKELEKSLSYSFITSYEVSAEHMDSNIHVHAFVHTTEYITKRKFSKFTSHLDLRKIKKDNGVQKYISKESPIFKDYRDLKKYIVSNV